MSNQNGCPKWDKESREKLSISCDQELTHILLSLMGFEHPVSTAKSIAVSLDLNNHHRVRHLLYRNSRVTAYEFLKILMKYERIRKYFGLQKLARSKNPFLRIINRDELHKKILILCSKNPKISATEIGNQLSLSKKAVEYMIQCLKMKRLLKRIGPARSGYWLVKGEKHEKKNRYPTNQNRPRLQK